MRAKKLKLKGKAVKKKKSSPFELRGSKWSALSTRLLSETLEIKGPGV